MFYLTKAAVLVFNVYEWQLPPKHDMFAQLHNGLRCQPSVVMPSYHLLADIGGAAAAVLLLLLLLVSSAAVGCVGVPH
jgi:hypothetical protein